MRLKKYKKITQLTKKFKFSDFDLLTNYGLLTGDTNLFKTITIIELIESIRNIPGDIIEFGVWNGNTSLLIKKILDIKKIKKKVFLFDHFQGLKHYTKKDPKISHVYKDSYVAPKKKINSFINFFNFKNIKIIDKDATKISHHDLKNFKFSLAILDMDLYLPTITALNAIEKKISKNGIIVFDEANKTLWEGEKKAMNEFLKKNPKKYHKTIISKSKQPDVILKKIK